MWFRAAQPSGGILLGAHQMKRNIGSVAQDPAVMTRRDLEDVARLQLKLLAIIHADHRAPLEHHPEVGNLTTARARDGGHMLGPLPAGFVPGAPERCAGDPDEV